MTPESLVILGFGGMHSSGSSWELGSAIAGASAGQKVAMGGAGVVPVQMAIAHVFHTWWPPVSLDPDNPYEVLGVEPLASQDEIDNTYREHALRLESCRESVESCDKELTVLKRAYDELRDATVRCQYHRAENVDDVHGVPHVGICTLHAISRFFENGQGPVNYTIRDGLGQVPDVVFGPVPGYITIRPISEHGEHGEHAASTREYGSRPTPSDATGGAWAQLPLFGSTNGAASSYRSQTKGKRVKQRAQEHAWGWAREGTEETKTLKDRLAKNKGTLAKWVAESTGKLMNQAGNLKEAVHDQHPRAVDEAVTGAKKVVKAGGDLAEAMKRRTSKVGEDVHEWAAEQADKPTSDGEQATYAGEKAGGFMGTVKGKYQGARSVFDSYWSSHTWAPNAKQTAADVLTSAVADVMAGQSSTPPAMKAKTAIETHAQTHTHQFAGAPTHKTAKTHGGTGGQRSQQTTTQKPDQDKRFSSLADRFRGKSAEKSPAKSPAKSAESRVQRQIPTHTQTHKSNGGWLSWSKGSEKAAEKSIKKSTGTRAKPRTTKVAEPRTTPPSSGVRSQTFTDKEALLSSMESRAEAYMSSLDQEDDRLRGTGKAATVKTATVKAHGSNGGGAETTKTVELIRHVKSTKVVEVTETKTATAVTTETSTAVTTLTTTRAYEAADFGMPDLRAITVPIDDVSTPYVLQTVQASDGHSGTVYIAVSKAAAGEFVAETTVLAGVAKPTVYSVQEDENRVKGTVHVLFPIQAAVDGEDDESRWEAGVRT